MKFEGPASVFEAVPEDVKRLFWPRIVAGLKRFQIFCWSPAGGKKASSNDPLEMFCDVVKKWNRLLLPEPRLYLLYYFMIVEKLVNLGSLS